MTLCEQCENRCSCTKPCPALEALINRDHVGYGTKNVFVQNAELPEGGQNEWLDYMNLKEGVELPEATVDMEVFDKLTVPLAEHLKRTLILFFVEGMSLTRIAYQEDVSKGAVRKRIMNSGKIIKRHLGNRRYYYLNVLPMHDRLTRKQQYISEKYFKEMQDVIAIANEFGTSPANVSQHIKRIREICG